MITDLLNLDLAKELGLDSLSPEKKKDLIDQMSDILESRINIEVLSILTEDDKREMDKLLASNGDLPNFLRSKIPNFDIMVAETVANFKREILEI